MDRALLARWRLANQLDTSDDVPGTAARVVGRLGAVQAQDVLPASWSLAQRAGGLDLADVAAELDTGAVLRTHLLRPTWHLVAPADVRWLLRATAPRVQRGNGPVYQRAGLDAEARSTTRRVLAGALADGRHRTRAELAVALGAAGFALTGQGLAYALMDAELEGVVCSGTARGGRQTYALLDERAPGAERRTREESLAELARRYLATRGPVTEHDLAAWASLTLAEARRATAAVAGELGSFEHDGLTWWHAPGEPPPPSRPAPRRPGPGVRRAGDLLLTHPRRPHRRRTAVRRRVPAPAALGARRRPRGRAVGLPARHPRPPEPGADPAAEAVDRGRAGRGGPGRRGVRPVRRCRPRLERDPRLAWTATRRAQEVAMEQPTSSDVRVVPANEASWEDVQTVLGRADQAHLCQCQRQVWADRLWFGMPFEERAFHLRQQTNAGDPDAPVTSAVVAYLGDEAVGWCEVGPRNGFLRVRNSPVAWKGRAEDKDDDTVWAAVCFVVRRGYRGRRITYALARGAAAQARAGGARAVEGYPMVTVPGTEVTWGELNVGPLSAFLAAGFHEVTRPTPRRAVVRLDL